MDRRNAAKVRKTKIKIMSEPKLISKTECYGHTGIMEAVIFIYSDGSRLVTGLESVAKSAIRAIVDSSIESDGFAEAIGIPKPIEPRPYKIY